MTEADTIHSEQIQTFIQQALAEDVGPADHTSEACIPADSRSTGQLLIKDAGVVAGVELAEQIFHFVDPTAQFERLIEDGASVNFGDIVFKITCNSRALLKAERLVLNSMQRMSGIASLSNRFKFEVEDLPVVILDTRKTTPMIRFLEKWAVRIGGCTNYRNGLYDWFMIKDNHIDACGGITQAIEQVVNYKKENNLDLGVTVEVRNLVELDEVLKMGNVNRIMLDNFELPLLREAVRVIDGRYESEASGGVSIHTVREIAKCEVDFVSVGALTHSAQSLDMSLKVVR
ncbi:MAG: carboxylating nicotinate-nucleotide diphosphorylase [Bacteroidota bacterium]